MRAKKSLSKKFITIGLVFSFLFAMVAPEVPVFTETVNAEGSLFAGGDGTASNPYIIKRRSSFIMLENLLMMLLEINTSSGKRYRLDRFSCCEFSYERLVSDWFMV